MADVNSTPLRGQHITGPFSAAQQPGVETLRRELRETMLHKLLCLPYKDWMDAFLPAQANDAEVDDEQFADMFNSVPLEGTEDKMYDPFVKAVNGAGILDGFMVAKTTAPPPSSIVPTGPPSRSSSSAS
ncbi:hypothetical protein NUW54_g9475 [Trametes sanguinea]|uniref:Uncharacterized protein n=1 Tax=Trametes sanguinea TaxID=158606 RepID=A0ACC1P5M9_9APHY|nr:hypothetical protein NUW54_g9475 [Trametes sanguinea]